MSKKKEWDGEEFLIGNYQLGYRMVDLYAMPMASGANFNFNLVADKSSFIKVGMDYDYISTPHANLTHEVMEVAMTDMDISLKTFGFEQNVSDCRWFFMNHNQFTEVASRSSWFLFKCHTDFLAAFKKVSAWRKNKK